MTEDAPIVQDHAGFAAEFRATREDRGWSLAFIAFAPFWTAIVCAGLSTEVAFDGGSVCMALTIPFIWGIVAIGTDVAITRHTLRLTNGQLLLETRKFFKRSRRVDLRGLLVEVHERFTNKGSRVVGFYLREADGRETRLNGAIWTTPDLEALADTLNRLAVQADPETALVPPEALQALRASEP